jgi:hypothetical protein
MKGAPARFAIVVLGLGGWFADASAQAPVRAAIGAEIRALLPGKTLVKRFTMRVIDRGGVPVVVPSDAPYTLSYFYRGDGSWSRGCVAHTPRGDIDCSGGRDRRNVGTWQIEGNRLCAGSIDFAASVFVCSELRRISPDTIELRQVSGIPEDFFTGTWSVR